MTIHYTFDDCDYDFELNRNELYESLGYVAVDYITEQYNIKNIDKDKTAMIISKFIYELDILDECVEYFRDNLKEYWEREAYSYFIEK